MAEKRQSPHVMPTLTPVCITDLGRVGYQQAFDVQTQLHADVLAGRSPETLLLVEHDPVITITRRPGVQQHLVADSDLLRRHGIEVCETNRGGDITYHGPGQIVAYPIVRLHEHGLNLRSYVHLLEQAIIDTLAHFDIPAHRDPAAVGVWVSSSSPSGGGREGVSTNSSTNTKSGAPSPNPSRREGSGTFSSPSGGGWEGVRQTTAQQPLSSKIAAIGVRAQRWVTMHGLALNVATNLDHFKLIVPCGLADRPVTSMKQLLADRCPDFDVVKHVLADTLLAMLSAPKNN